MISKIPINNTLSKLPPPDVGSYKVEYYGKDGKLLLTEYCETDDLYKDDASYPNPIHDGYCEIYRFCGWEKVMTRGHRSGIDD